LTFFFGMNQTSSTNAYTSSKLVFKPKTDKGKLAPQSEACTGCNDALHNVGKKHHCHANIQKSDHI